MCFSLRLLKKETFFLFGGGSQAAYLVIGQGKILMFVKKQLGKINLTYETLVNYSLQILGENL